MVSTVLQWCLGVGLAVSLVAFSESRSWGVRLKSLGLAVLFPIGYLAMYDRSSFARILGFEAPPLDGVVAFVEYMHGTELVAQLWLSVMVAQFVLHFTGTRADMPHEIVECLNWAAIGLTILIALAFISGTIPR